MPEPLDDAALERSAVVANNAMNRVRGLAAYRRDLSADPLALLREHPEPVWIDLCCGAGRALAEAAEAMPAATIVGVDLVDFFGPLPPSVRAVVASVTALPELPAADLVTCVHGLHYVGDKLRALSAAAALLRPGGRFVASFDAAGVRDAAGRPLGRPLTAVLRRAGFAYDTRRRLLAYTRPDHARLPEWPWRYLGADDRAGPNYTGQDAVAGLYATLP